MNLSLSCHFLYDVSIHSYTHGLRSYHSVLVIDFNYDDWWVISQLTGLPKQLHVIEHQQLVPCRAECLTQDLQKHTHTASMHFTHNRYKHTHTYTQYTQTPTSVTWLCVEKKTRAKGSERPLLSAANKLRAWYMCALSWNTCFTVGHTNHIALADESRLILKLEK